MGANEGGANEGAAPGAIMSARRIPANEVVAKLLVAFIVFFPSTGMSIEGAGIRHFPELFQTTWARVALREARLHRFAAKTGFAAKTDEVGKELFYRASGRAVGLNALSCIHAGLTYLADLVGLRGRPLAANRRSVLRIDPPPYDRAPGTNPVIDAYRSVIGSCQFARDAGKGTRCAGNQQERQKNSG
jgi:hypothetical protein